VGPKGAAALLRRYGTLEQAIAEGSFVEQADQLKLYKKLATMDPTAPLPPLDDQSPTWANAAALVRQWELGRLADRLDELAASPATRT
jgi:DNA polymerase-1